MVNGTVKFFNTTRNFGFISGDDSKEYFVHGSGIADQNNIREAENVKLI